MLARFYIVIDDKNHEFDDEGMQDFIIQHAGIEGVLYHTEMTHIKILYNKLTGEVRLMDSEERQGMNTDYANAFSMQRRLVELALRRLTKLDLLAELHQLNDKQISDLIHQHHSINPQTGRPSANTSEIALDMTLVKVINLGYVRQGPIWQWLSGLVKINQTPVQRAIYSAFEDFKKECEPHSHVLTHFRSKNSIEQFKQYIRKYLV